MKHQITKRIVSLALILALLAGFAVPTQATGNEMREISFTQVDNSVVADHLADREVVTAEEEKPDPNAEVRVSIVLMDESTIGAGFSTVGIAQNAEAMAYRAALKENQAAVTTAIEQALDEAKQQGIHGKETTPFLLAKVVELTGGESLESICAVEAVHATPNPRPNCSDGTQWAAGRCP